MSTVIPIKYRKGADLNCVRCASWMMCAVAVGWRVAGVCLLVSFRGIRVWFLHERRVSEGSVKEEARHGVIEIEERVAVG